MARHTQRHRAQLPSVKALQTTDVAATPLLRDLVLQVRRAWSALAPRPAAPQAAVRFEALEPRLLLAADLATLAGNGTLTLNLTEGSDQVVVEQVATGSNGVIVNVSVGGLTQQYGMGLVGVTSLVANGLGGDDNFSLKNLSVPSNVVGGTGHDSLAVSTGAGADSVHLLDQRGAVRQQRCRHRHARGHRRQRCGRAGGHGVGLRQRPTTRRQRVLQRPNGVGTPLLLQVTETPALQQTTLPTTYHHWTPNRSYPTLAQATVSSTGAGTGTGLTVRVVADAGGIPRATVVNPGSGYSAGDTISFSAPDAVGNALTMQVLPVFTQPTFANDFVAWTAAKTYTTVQHSDTSGSGTGLSVRIDVDAQGRPVVSAGQDFGSGYVQGNTLTFDAPDGVGTAIVVTLSGQTQRQIISINWLPNQVFNGLAASATSGAGSGLTGHVTTDAAGVLARTTNPSVLLSAA